MVRPIGGMRVRLKGHETTDRCTAPLPTMSGYAHQLTSHLDVLKPSVYSIAAPHNRTAAAQRDCRCRIQIVNRYDVRRIRLPLAGSAMRSRSISDGSARCPICLQNCLMSPGSASCHGAVLRRIEPLAISACCLRQNASLSSIRWLPSPFGGYGHSSKGQPRLQLDPGSAVAAMPTVRVGSSGDRSAANDVQLWELLSLDPPARSGRSFPV